MPNQYTGLDKPIYIRLAYYFGEYSIEYRFRKRDDMNRPQDWTKLMPITKEQADWMIGDGWTVFQKGHSHAA